MCLVLFCPRSENMGSLYIPVKYALLVILTLGLVVVIINLVPELQRNRSHTNVVVVMIIQLIVLLVGLVGAYRDNRQLLLTFALILTILVIVAVVQSQAMNVVGNAVLDIISILLAVYQSEMIRSGDIKYRHRNYPKADPPTRTFASAPAPARPPLERPPLAPFNRPPPSRSPPTPFSRPPPRPPPKLPLNSPSPPPPRSPPILPLLPPRPSIPPVSVLAVLSAIFPPVWATPSAMSKGKRIKPPSPPLLPCL
ncbi:hypothetical protein GZH46_02434, partial [Fragariocoptes setiger]